MNGEQPGVDNPLFRRHLQIAWWSLLCFVILGITLEIAHAFKSSWYLGKTAEMRRLMWTLAHAHGTLLALVHAAFAFTCFALSIRATGRHRFTSALLTGASVLLPGGFFLGGTFLHDGDPGLGVWLVPVGAFCLLLAVFLTAIAAMRGKELDEPPRSDV